MNNVKQVISTVQILVARMYIAIHRLVRGDAVATRRDFIRMWGTYCIICIDILSNTNNVTSSSCHLELFWAAMATFKASKAVMVVLGILSHKCGGRKLPTWRCRDERKVFGMNEVLQIYVKVWIGHQDVKVHKLISSCRIGKNPSSSTNFARSPQCRWGVACLL